MGPDAEVLRVAIAVHQPLIHKGIHDLARTAGFSVDPGEIFDFESLLKYLTHIPILAMIILSATLPGMHGAQGVGRMRSRFHSVPALVIVDHARRDVVVELVAAGADGVVALSSDPETMVRAMAAVSSGGLYVPPFLEDISSEPLAHMATGAVLKSLSNLTARQREVLRWLSRGDSNKAIARRLEISPHTVNMHIRAIFRLLDVHSRVEAVNMLAMLRQKDEMPPEGPSRRKDDGDRPPMFDDPSDPDEPGFKFS